MKKSNNLLNHLFNFLAVILGVYMAFYVNEKAKIKEDKKESLAFMQSLVSDLSEDIKTYEEYQIPKNIQYQQNVSRLLPLLADEDIEKINTQLSEVFQIENYTPTTSTYTSMKSSGKLGFIKDLTLQKELSNYYEGLVIESIKKGEFQVAFFTNELLTWIVHNVDLSEMKILNRNDLIVFRNKLMIYESLISQKISSYENIVENSKKLKMSIEAAIHTLKM